MIFKIKEKLNSFTVNDTKTTIENVYKNILKSFSFISGRKQSKIRIKLKKCHECRRKFKTISQLFIHLRGHKLKRRNKNKKKQKHVRVHADGIQIQIDHSHQEETNEKTSGHFNQLEYLNSHEKIHEKIIEATTTTLSNCLENQNEQNSRRNSFVQSDDLITTQCDLILNDSDNSFSCLDDRTQLPIEQVDQSKITSDVVNQDGIVSSSINSIEPAIEIDDQVNDLISLNQHKEIRLDFSCDKCKMKYKSSRDLARHSQVHKLVACDECEKKFKDSTALRYHKIFHLEKENNKFRENSNDSKTKETNTSSLNCKSLRSGKILAPTKSAILKIKDSRKSKLLAHMRNKGEINDFNCIKCSKSFTTSNYLKVHMSTHSNEKPYACNQCEKKFRYTGYLIRHLKIHKGDTSSQSCNFKRAHKRNHSDQKPNKCEQYDLIKHKRTHSKKDDLEVQVKPQNNHRRFEKFSCDQCEKTFSTLQMLSVHKRIHKEMKPLKCDQCDMTFKQSHHLISHKRIHIRNEKLYKCDQCEYKFAQSNDLKIHKRIHSDQKNYSCNQCELKFKHKNSLAVHKRAHLGN